MKKNKIKKIASTVIAVIILIPKRVFARINNTFVVDEKNAIISLYGVEPPFSIKAWNFCKAFIIPIALIVGIVVYLTKSKSSKKRKIITVSIILLLVIVIYIIFRILYNR